MGTDATQERQQAHALLDKLPQEKLTAVVHLLQAISDPLARQCSHRRRTDQCGRDACCRSVEGMAQRSRAHFPRTSAHRMGRTPLDPYSKGQ